MDFDSIYEKRQKTSAALREASIAKMKAERDYHLAAAAEADAWLEDDAEAAVCMEAEKEMARRSDEEFQKQIAAMPLDPDREWAKPDVQKLFGGNRDAYMNWRYSQFSSAPGGFVDNKQELATPMAGSRRKPN